MNNSSDLRTLDVKADSPSFMDRVVSMSAKRKRPRSTRDTATTPSSANESPSALSSLTHLRNLFGIDLRSIAAFRMAIGALLLIDLCIRASDLNAMYSDGGMFPRSVICRYYHDFWNWSFHFGSGAWEYQALLFVIAAVLATAVLVGYETRLALIGSWLMLVSLQNRVPPILDGSDNLLRMLMFWGIFLPLDGVWSLSRSLNPHRESVANSGPSVLSVATAAVLLQMGLMYLFSAIFKCNDDWLQGEAIAGALKHDFYSKPIASSLLAFPGLLRFLTLCVFAVEWLAAVLLFCPKFTFPVRLFGIALLVAMHLGIAVCLNVGLFSYVCLAGLLVFLPASFWDRILTAFPVLPGSNAIKGTNLPDSGGIWKFYATQIICGVALIYVVGINVNSLASQPLAKLGLEKSGLFWSGLGLGQKWNMFDEIPSKDGWYVAKARLQDGEQVDLLADGKPVNWNRPSAPSRIYPNERWQKIFREMAYFDAQGYQVFREPVAQYVVRRWNAKQANEKQVVDFEFIFCLDTGEDSPPKGEKSRELLIHLDFSADGK